MFGNVSIIWKILYWLAILPVYGIFGILPYSMAVFYVNDFIFEENKNFIFYVKIFLSFIFYLCVAVVYITHTRCLITDPGGIPLDFNLRMKEENKNLPVNESGLPLLQYKNNENTTLISYNTYNARWNENESNTEKSK